MNRLSVSVILACVALVATSVVVAGDDEKVVTLEGKLVCAKCALHEEGREQCQNVLVVQADDAEEHYYMDETPANDTIGYVCTATKGVRVTGTVTEKDGQLWIAAEEIAPIEDKG